MAKAYVSEDGFDWGDEDIEVIDQPSDASQITVYESSNGFLVIRQGTEVGGHHNDQCIFVHPANIGEFGREVQSVAAEMGQGDVELTLLKTTARALVEELDRINLLSLGIDAARRLASFRDDVVGSISFAETGLIDPTGELKARAIARRQN